ncbi:MAG: GGDEF domain-containing protein [Desulfobacterium sp.]|nr:GGDEF domain-containing protein [Desulfobacterium sp.]
MKFKLAHTNINVHKNLYKSGHIMSAIDELVKDETRLPSPPAIAIRILEAVKEDDSNYDELAEIILSDPSLAAKTLKAANSSIYGLPQRVGSLKMALSIIGLTAVKNIALSFIIAKELRTNSEEGFDFDLFWKRSVTAAVASDLCAVSINNKNDEDFVRGLLQDIGIVIMYLCRKDDYLRMLDEKCVSGLSIEDAENKIFGFDHQKVGSEILKKWGLPESVYMPISYHHKKTDTPSKYALSVDILYLSNKISSIYHGSNSSDNITEIKALIGGKYQKTKEEIDSLIDAVAKKSIEIFSLFEIEANDMTPYSQIIEEVNEELVKLNLSYEELLIKYKEAKNQADSVAKRLQVVNEKLKAVSIRDGLTGLYNHVYFQKHLDIELSRTIRYRKPISLMMLDLDYFKKINDAHGHRIGDIVLKKISALILNQVRISDITSRYGGEEFAIILPETELKDAAVLAERIRTSVEQNEIMTDSNTVKVTISIGVATYIPASKILSKSELLDAADSALYASKHSGRNKLSMVKLSQNISKA